MIRIEAPIGKRFGRLVVTGEAPPKGNKRHWYCLCDCGKTRSVATTNLNGGRQVSCGCFKHELQKKIHITHGASKVQGASNWYAMIQRCDSPRATHYERYGGRGITVCECLRVSIWNLLFVAGDKPSPKHTIERMDSDLHYSCGFCHHCQRMGWKKNVTWATRKEQSLNRSDSVKLTFGGVTKCLSEWADEAGIGRKTFAGRLEAGRDPFLRLRAHHLPAVIRP